MDPVAILIVIIIFIIIVLFGRMSILLSRIRRLERTVRKLQEQVGGQTVDVPPEPVASAPPAPQVQSSPAGKPPPPSRTREEWETLVGGQLLNRIGAVALIIGMAFFLKYAFDNDWLNETTRVIIGVVSGFLLIGGGGRFHQKGLQIFAQGLLGAGIAILYLSVYASFDFYQLVSQITAFICMSVVTALAFVLALYFNAQVISLLGWVGGFTTPFLLNTGIVNTVGLFTYITLLDVGLVGVLIKRSNWRALAPLTVLATYGTYMIWAIEVYPPDYSASAFLFLSIFWGLFTLLDLSHIVQVKTQSPLYRLVAVLNAVCFYTAVYVLVEDVNSDATAGFTLAIGMVYGGILLAIKSRTEDDAVRAHYGLAAVLLVVIATYQQFSPFATIQLWALEALALAWGGLHWSRVHLFKVSVGLFLFTGVALCVMDSGLQYTLLGGFTFVLNARSLSFLVLAATMGCSTLLMRRYDRPEVERFRNPLHAGWCIALFLWCSVEINDVFRLMISRTPAGNEMETLQNMQQLAISGGWLGYAIILMGIGMWRRVQIVRFAAIAFFGLAILKIFLYDLSFLDTLFRIFSFISLGLILLVVSYLYQRFKSIILTEP